MTQLPLLAWLKRLFPAKQSAAVPDPCADYITTISSPHFRPSADDPGIERRG